MLGKSLDRIFVHFSSEKGNLPKTIRNYSKKVPNSKTLSVYFLPETCYDTNFIKKKILAQKENTNIYVLPSVGKTIKSNPIETKEFLDKILKDAITKTKKSNPKKINVMGISLGNVLAFNFATKFKVDNLISVVPGSRLAECIWESIATKQIAEQSGRTLENYQKALKDYNPIEAAKKIKANNIEIYLGKSDLMIPYKRGKELANKIPKAKVFKFRASGHAETIFRFTRIFRKRI